MAPKSQKGRGRGRGGPSRTGGTVDAKHEEAPVPFEAKKVPKRTVVDVEEIEPGGSGKVAPPQPSKPAPFAAVPAVRLAKKAKIDEDDPIVKLCRSLSTGLAGATKDLSKQCHDLFHALSVGSLPTPQSDRHPVQKAAIDLLGRVVKDIEASRISAVKVAEEAAAAEARKKASLDEASRVSGAKASEKRHAAQRQQDALLQANQAADAAADALAAAMSMRENRQAEIAGRADEKCACEAALNSELILVRDGASIMKNGVFMRPDDPKHVAKLQKLVDGIEFDETLKNAFPHAAAKSPAFRSELERRVLVELEGALAAHIKKLEVQIAETDPAAVAVADDEAIKAAESAADRARAQADVVVGRTNDAAEAAAEAEEEATHSCRMAQLAADACALADKKLEAARCSLVEWRDGPMKTLRELTGKPVAAQDAAQSSQSPDPPPVEQPAEQTATLEVSKVEAKDAAVATGA